MRAGGEVQGFANRRRQRECVQMVTRMKEMRESDSHRGMVDGCRWSGEPLVACLWAEWPRAGRLSGDPRVSGWLGGDPGGSTALRSTVELFDAALERARR